MPGQSPDRPKPAVSLRAAERPTSIREYPVVPSAPDQVPWVVPASRAWSSVAAEPQAGRAPRRGGLLDALVIEARVLRGA